MIKRYLPALLIILLAGGLVAGCTGKPQETVAPEATEPAESADELVIYSPASTSSIPVILASQKMDNVKLELYTNQSQANTLFLRGEVDILVTGLSVGVELYSNDAPVQMIDSFVSGLSYMVTYGKTVNDFSGLKGGEVYIPFKGSPIEEVASYLAATEGLEWGKDLTPVYSPFDSSIELLKQGKAAAVILPEPNVTLVEGEANINISFSLFDAWNKTTGSEEGYPQVGSFVNPQWAETHPSSIAEFNQALEEAIAQVQQDPQGAVDGVKDYYKLSPEKLSKSLSRTRYAFTAGEEMKKAMENYFQLIGKSLDEKDTDFYFIAGK